MASLRAAARQLLVLWCFVFCAALRPCVVPAPHTQIFSRRAALALTPLLAHAGTPASAADKGKEYNSCLSQCVYDATKIAKGIAKVEVMSREDAFEKCKLECKPKIKK